MPIEKLCVRTLAHGVEPQQNLLQGLLGIELMGVGIIAFVLRLDEIIEVGENGIVLRAHPPEIGPLCDAPLGIELGYHDLDGVDMGVRKVLVGPKKVFQKRSVLGQPRVLSEGFRRRRIVRLSTVIPALGLQHVDDVLPGHEVGKAAAHSFAHLSLLVLDVQRDDRLAGLQQI